MTRIYQNIPLTVGTEITLDEAASHHVATVLRAKTGEKLIVFNGDGCDYEATILLINKKKVVIALMQGNVKNTESSLKLHLAQGIARGEKMDFIVQKAVELGATSITPLLTARSNMRLSAEQRAKKMAHWQAILVAACEQSGRTKLPTLHLIESLSSWLSKAHGTRFLLSPHAENPLPSSLTTSEISLVIGPEGGLSPEEITLALSHHFQPLKLGPRVLRTETATIAALAILQQQYGDMS
jgi:16S rRNA (uracil1498-N3)-methyltransferase